MGDTEMAVVMAVVMATAKVRFLFSLFQFQKKKKGKILYHFAVRHFDSNLDQTKTDTEETSFREDKIERKKEE